MRRRAAALLAGLALLVGCAACTGAQGGTPAASNNVVTDTVTRTPTARPTVPVPASAVPLATVAPLPPGASTPPGFTQAPCPYLSTDTARNIEGNRIYRTAISTGAGPVTCRFYFWCCDYHATLEVQPQVLGSTDAAYNAMVRTGEAGRNVIGVPNLVPGVDGVLFQAPFYGPDGDRDWACAFAKGSTLVVVRTDQVDVSFNARQLGAALAPAF